MRAFPLIARLCIENWKTFVSWMLVGPLFFVCYGASSYPGSESAWATLLAIGLILGAFIAALLQVNSTRSKRNKSLKAIEIETRNLAERELHIAFSIVGVAFGTLIAKLLTLPPIGYLICVVLLIVLGLSRTVIEQIIP
jgi:hypothetical protein